MSRNSHLQKIDVRLLRMTTYTLCDAYSPNIVIPSHSGKGVRGPCFHIIHIIPRSFLPWESWNLSPLHVTDRTLGSAVSFHKTHEWT